MLGMGCPDDTLILFCYLSLLNPFTGHGFDVIINNNNDNNNGVRTPVPEDLPRRRDSLVKRGWGERDRFWRRQSGV